MIVPKATLTVPRIRLHTRKKVRYSPRRLLKTRPSGCRRSLRLLADGDHAIRFDMGELLPGTAWPVDLDFIGLFARTEPKVQPQVVLREIAAAAPDHVDLATPGNGQP